MAQRRIHDLTTATMLRSITQASERSVLPLSALPARNPIQALRRPCLSYARPSSRSYTSTPSRSAQYERFPTSRGQVYEPQYSKRGSGSGSSNGSSGGGGNSSGGGGGSGKDYWNHPLLGALKRRLGDRGLVIFGVGGTGSLGYYLFHLERVPETGRLRFIDVSPSSEISMGLDAEKETLAQYRGQVLPSSHPTSKRVREVAKRVVESNGLGRMKGSGGGGGVGGVITSVGGVIGGDGGWGWEGASGQGLDADKGKEVEWDVFVIKDDATKNAFVLPGGKIFVFTGILPVCKNDDGLASVLGHEVAHQVARHSAERMSSMKVLFVLGYALEMLGLDVGFTRILLTYLLQLPNSRTNESEADYIGVRLMSKACFDPRESTRMWTRMSESEKGGGVQSKVANVDFLSTHPANQKRIASLEKWMPEALDIRAASPCGDTSNQFEAFREHAPMGRSERIWA